MIPKNDQNFDIKVINQFLTQLRERIKNITNKESRAPHYLLHSADRMTQKQAKEFFAKKLKFQVSDEILQQVLTKFNSTGLMDMRRIIFHAMRHDADGVLGKDQALINGASVTVDANPATLQHLRYTPLQITEMLYIKILGRMKTDQSLNGLRKLLLENGQESRLVSRQSIRKLLSNFDIIVNQEDFEAFFSKFDRGDGKVIVRKFFETILNVDQSNYNPFIPKSDEDFKLQRSLAHALSIVTGHRRDIPFLQGSTEARLQGEILSNVKKSNESTETYVIKNVKPKPDQNFETESIASGLTSLDQLSIKNSYDKSIYSEEDSMASDIYSMASNSFQPSRPMTSSTVSTFGSSRVRRHFTSKNNSQNRNQMASNPFSDSRSITSEDLEDLFPSTPTESKTKKTVEELNQEILLNSFNKFYSSKSPQRPSVSKPSNNSTRSNKMKNIHPNTNPIPPNHVDTGRTRSFAINANNKLLKQKYHVSKGNTVTASEDYGLFLRSLEREKKMQKKLQTKYNLENFFKKQISNQKERNEMEEEMNVLDFNDIDRFQLNRKIRSQSRNSRNKKDSNSIASNVWK